jgi:hypothetical protein
MIPTRILGGLAVVWALSLGLTVHSQQSTSTVTVREDPAGERSIDLMKGPFAIAGRVVSWGAVLPDLLVSVGIEGEGLSYSSRGVPLSQDGTFKIGGLANGTYILEAKGDIYPPRIPHAASEYGYAAVTVEDGDRTDVIITTQRDVSVRGVVRLEGGTGPPTSQGAGCGPNLVTGMRALLATDVTTFMGPAESAAVAADGTFAFLNLGGPRVIRWGNGCGPWRLERVLLDGADVTNEPIDFAHRAYTKLEAVFSDAAQGLSVRVVDGEGRPVPQAWVAVLSSDSAEQKGWSNGTIAQLTNKHGRTGFPLLPAEYLTMALPQEHFPTASSVLKRFQELEATATKVTIPGGAEPVEIELVLRR